MSAERPREFKKATEGTWLDVVKRMEKKHDELTAPAPEQKPERSPERPKPSQKEIDALKHERAVHDYQGDKEESE